MNVKFIAKIHRFFILGYLFGYINKDV